MTLHKHSPLHDKWHRRVEGQIRHTVGKHPEWFMGDINRMINSLAKRIVGEIVADSWLAQSRGEDVSKMSSACNDAVSPNCDASVPRGDATCLSELSEQWGKPVEALEPKSLPLTEKMKNFGKPSQKCLDDIAKINRNIIKAYGNQS